MENEDIELRELLLYDWDRIKKMSSEQLEPLVRRIQRIARNRKKDVLKELKELGISTPTIYRKFKEKKGKVVTQSRLTFRIYTKKLENEEQKNNYLKSLFLEAKKFLEAPTSTIEGWYKTINKFRSTIEQHTKQKFNFGDVQNDKETFKTFFEMYNELKAASTEWKNLDSAQALKYINDYMVEHKNMSKDEMVNFLKNRADEVYMSFRKKGIENDEEDEDEDDGDFFTHNN